MVCSASPSSDTDMGMEVFISPDCPARAFIDTAGCSVAPTVADAPRAAVPENTARKLADIVAVVPTTEVSETSGESVFEM